MKQWIELFKSVHPLRCLSTLFNNDAHSIISEDGYKTLNKIKNNE